MTDSILKPLRPLHETPGFTDAFARVVATSSGFVCEVCGLERMGHAPESKWLGYDRHDWTPTPATPDMIERARNLTTAAYAARKD